MPSRAHTAAGEKQHGSERQQPNASPTICHDAKLDKMLSELGLGDIGMNLVRLVRPARLS